MKELFDAITSNNVTKVEVEARETNNLNERSYYCSKLDCYFSPLHLASYLGFTDIIKLLLEKGADINLKTSEKNNFGQTLLTVVTFTLWSRAGAYTALHLAEMNSHYSAVSYLLACNADFMTRDRKYHLPLSLEELCAHYPDHVSNRMLDLSHFQYEISDKHLDNIKRLFSIDSMKSIILRQSSLSQEGFFKLLSFVLDNKSLTSIHFNMKIFTPILRFSLKSYKDGFELLMENLERILQLVQHNSIISEFYFGAFIHRYQTVKTETTFQIRERKYSTQTEVTYHEEPIFHLGSEFITKIAQNPEGSKQELSELNKKQIMKCAPLQPLFTYISSYYEFSIIEPQVVVEKCQQIHQQLITNFSLSRGYQK